MGQISHLETMDENFQLGLKLATDKESTIFVIKLWNFVDMDPSWAGNNDQISSK